MKIGYARTSTTDQKAGFEAQIKQLDALDCERIYREQASSVAERPQLDRLLDSLRGDDHVIVTKLDRLARSVIDLGNILKTIDEAGASIQIVDLGVDTSTPTGKLMLNVMGSIAQFEREMMLERQKVGIEKAKLEGKYKGRPGVTFSLQQVEKLKNQGLNMGQVAAELGVTRQAIYKRLKEAAQ
jgi:DNA invertase Pin-like site-specific DNA recombinase